MVLARVQTTGVLVVSAILRAWRTIKEQGVRDDAQTSAKDEERACEREHECSLLAVAGECMPNP